MLACAASVGLAQDGQTGFESESLFADADSRTTLLTPTGTIGYDQSRGIGLSDGANSMYVRVFTDFRYVLNFRKVSAVGGDAKFTNGWQNANTWIQFEGTVGDPRLSYSVRLRASDLESQGGGIFLADQVFGEFAFDDNWSVRWGQFRLPFVAEWYMIDDPYQLGIQQSINTQYWSPRLSQGLQVEWANEDFQVLGAISDGFRTANTDIDSTSAADIALTGRLNWKMTGDWESSATADSFNGSDDFAYIGGAFHYQSGGRSNGTPNANGWFLTVDGAYKASGWNMRGSITTQSWDPAGASRFNNTGLNFQLGKFLFSDQVEVYAQWDSLLVDKTSTGLGSSELLNFLTLGAKYFVVPDSHAMVFAFDVVYAFNPTTPLTAVGLFGGGAPFLPDTSVPMLGMDEDQEVSIRLSLRLLF